MLIGRRGKTGNERDWERLRNTEPDLYRIFSALEPKSETERRYCEDPKPYHDWLNWKTRRQAQVRAHLRQLISQLFLENTHAPAKGGILKFFHDSQHLRCEPIEQHLYAHSEALIAIPRLRIGLERKFKSILAEVLESLSNRLPDFSRSQEVYLLDEYALLKTASLLAPDVYRQCVPELEREMAPFAVRSSILHSIFLGLRAWGSKPHIVTEGEVRYRDLYASRSNSPEGQAHGQHLLWYCGLYNEPVGLQFLNSNQYQAKAIVQSYHDRIRQNIVEKTYASCCNKYRNPAWAQSDLCKLSLSMQLLDGAWNRLTLDEADKLMECVLFIRSITGATHTKDLLTPRIRWILSTVERILRNPPYYIKRQILSDELRKIIEDRCKP